MGISERWEYHYHKGNTRPTCPPHSLNLEPTNACNLRCPKCSLDLAARMVGFMELDFFSGLVKQAAEIGVAEIRLFLAGEPFLHKQMGEMVEVCTRHGLRSIIHTNGTRMDGEKARAVMDAGLSEISFSIDGIDKGSYEIERPGAKFEETMDNVRSLLSQMKKKNAKSPRVIIQSIVPVGYPLNPPKHVTELLTGLPIDHYKVIYPHNWRGEVNLGRTRHETRRPQPCMFLWHELSVGWDGRVMGCCADLNGEFIRGDLKKESILDVWNNDKAVALREAHVNRAPFAHPLCRTCSVPYQKQKVTPLTKLFRQEAKAMVKSLLGMGAPRRTE